MSRTSLGRLAEEIRAGFDRRASVCLGFGSMWLGVESNSAEIVHRLTHYFRAFVLVPQPGPPHVRITVIEADPPDLGLAFTHWKPEPGKTRPKDAVADLHQGRVVKKVRTGMQFLVGKGDRVAVGPALDNLNQVINFITAQFITWMMHRGWLLGHAAGVVKEGRGLGIAARSGVGKSTLSLRLLSRGWDFASNDRLLVKMMSEGPVMSGVPKFPRINPGTALTNPDLSGILDPDRREELKKLDPDELWDLEEKLDVDVGELFGAGRIRMTAPLDALVVLNWDRARPEPARLRPVSLGERPDLLGFFMKPPGPFYVDEGGVPPSQPYHDPPEGYRRILDSVPVAEVWGGVDFEAAAEMSRELLQSGPSAAEGICER